MVHDEWFKDLGRLNNKIGNLAITRYNSLGEDLARIQSRTLVRQIVRSQAHTQVAAGIAVELIGDCLQYIETKRNNPAAVSTLSSRSIDTRIADIGMKQINDSLKRLAEVLTGGNRIETLQVLVVMFLKEVVDITPALNVVKLAWKFSDLREALRQAANSTDEADRALLKLEAFNVLAYTGVVSAIVAVTSFVSPVSVETLGKSIDELAREAMSAASRRVDLMLAEKLSGYPADLRT